MVVTRKRKSELEKTEAPETCHQHTSSNNNTTLEPTCSKATQNYFTQYSVSECTNISELKKSINNSKNETTDLKCEAETVSNQMNSCHPNANFDSSTPSLSKKPGKLQRKSPKSDDEIESPVKHNVQGGSKSIDATSEFKGSRKNSSVTKGKTTTSDNRNVSESEIKSERPKRMCRQVPKIKIESDVDLSNSSTKGKKNLSMNSKPINTRKRSSPKNNAEQFSRNDSEPGSSRKKIKNDPDYERDVENKISNISDTVRVSKLRKLTSQEEQNRKTANVSGNDKGSGSEIDELNTDKKFKNKSKHVNSIKHLPRKEAASSESESVSESESEWTGGENSESESDWEEEENLLKVPKSQPKQRRKKVASSSESDSGTKLNRVKKMMDSFKTKKQNIVLKGYIRKLSESESDEDITNIQLSKHILEKVKTEPVRKTIFAYNEKLMSTRDLAEARLSGDRFNSTVDEKLSLKTRLPDVKPLLKYFGPYLPLGEASTSSTVSPSQLISNFKNRRCNSASSSVHSAEIEESRKSPISCYSTTNKLKDDPDKVNNLSASKFKKNKDHIEVSVSVASRSSKGNTNEDSSSAESDWEEVSDVEQKAMTLEEYNPKIPKDGIEITIDVPDPKKRRRKKRQEEFATYARRHINRFKKDTQIAMHKIHLLSFIAHSLFLNQMLNDSDLKGIILSILPNDFLGITTKKTASTLLTKMVLWFRNTFVLEQKETDDHRELIPNLLSCIDSKTVNSADQYCYLFIVMGRVMKLDVRLCKSVYPISFKPADLIKTKKQLIKVVDLTEGTSRSQSPKIEPQRDEKPRTVSSGSKIPKKKSMNVKATTSNDSKKKCKPNQELKEMPKIEKFKPEKKRSRGSRKKVSYKENQSEESDSDDKDFKPVIKCVKNPLPNTKKNQNNLSSDSEGDKNLNKHNRTDVWAEVFLNVEGKWVSVDIVRNVVSCPYEIEANTSYPISHVLAVDNESKVKDVTQRYASNWLTHVRKERVDPDWWEESLEPYVPLRDKKDREEQKQLDAMLLDKPLPAKIGDFKNHPLYVLKRHLLKFEGLYPPDPPPMGFIRSEAIYARECVRMLHSRETWLKQGRGVKLGEQPYKVVKARPKWDKVNHKIVTDLPLDVFGEWQTEVYVPPPCKDGKVPRNEYGNIEIFQPSMIPKGAVHLQSYNVPRYILAVPGLSRVARKLGIDCAPALVGFEGNGWTGCMPVFDGFVICEEFKEVMIAAWDEEQINIARREKEKYDKRVYGNWRKLIRGLLIREKIKSNYFREEDKGKVK